MAEHDVPKVSPFGKLAKEVDSFFEKKYYYIGSLVGSRPLTSIALTLLFCLVCVSGFSQLKSESRSDKLWIPQGTKAQKDEAKFSAYFPPLTRMASILLEAKSGNGALTRDFLLAALELHAKVEEVQYGNDTLRTLCTPMPGMGHPCFINSVLGTWSYNLTILRNDNNPLLTLNGSQTMNKRDLQRMLGYVQFSGNTLQSAKALRISYFLQSNRVLSNGGYDDPRGEGWEKKFLELLKCDSPTCSDKECACGYSSPQFTVYAQAQRSFSDAFRSVIQGDVTLINMAFFIMIIYLILNLGGLCHKVRSRALLAFACTISIVLAGAAGYGISMWLQFDYTPVHSVLPFVILGIGVDDSFVIMNAYDRSDPNLSVRKRIAEAISHAGVSIMVTSITDFVAFAISVSSSLPALSAFCMYAAWSVLMLFLFQVTFFAALATLDAHRVNNSLMDCCPCCPCGKKGCCCCPIVPAEEADAAIAREEKDPNQLCCMPPTHKGGRIGEFLETKLAPKLASPGIAAVIVVVSAIFCSICIWQATLLSVEDSQKSFVPDDSYFMTTMEKNDEYFGALGQKVDIMTQHGDYHAHQQGLTSMGRRLEQLSYMQPSSGASFISWPDSYKHAVISGSVIVNSIPVAHNNGIVTSSDQYYDGLAAWLRGPGARYTSNVKWVDAANPRQGVQASRISSEFKPFTKTVKNRRVVDADRAVEVMDSLRDTVGGWTDVPGGALAYNYSFLTWETFRIIKRELFLSVGLCLLAVFIITLILIAHPLTSLLVFLCVCMTIVDILGCMNMWGLSIDNVTVIQLVISVGLCVDYAAHIGHCFMKQNGTRPERVVATLGDVGAAVLNGGVSTFLATMMLALSKSYVFRVLFQTFFLTVVLGLAHGLLLLPALLALFGPPSYTGDDVVVPIPVEKIEIEATNDTAAGS